MYISKLKENDTPDTKPLGELERGEFGVITDNFGSDSGTNVGDVVTRLEETGDILAIHPKIVVWGNDIFEYRYRPVHRVNVTIEVNYD